MSNLKKTMVVGLTVLTMGAVSFCAHAQSGAGADPAATTAAPAHAPVQRNPGGHGAHHGHGRPDAKRMAEHQAKRWSRLHDELKLTATQEPAWNAFQASMKPATPPGPRPDRSAWKSMPAPERMEQRLSHMKQVQAEMTVQLVELKRFYAVLTPVQQKVFDEKTARGPDGGRHGRGHRDGEHRGPGAERGGPGAPSAVKPS